MKKVLFIDRDGTLIIEPSIDYQVDSLEKLSFCPSVIGAMSKIAKLNFELVMVTNQDGMGSKSFPEISFRVVHNKMLELFEGEGVVFDKQFIDCSFEYENLPTRKPGIAMLTQYINNKEYDLENSYVIGDRITDVQLAKNLGTKAIYFTTRENGEKQLSENNLWDSCSLITTSWNDIYNFLRLGERRTTITRTTAETDIVLTLDLDGSGENRVDTGLGMLNHMLNQLIYHAYISLDIRVKGDLYVDEHHTIEDVAIVLGEAIRKCLGNKQSINRYGFSLPMDECDAMVLLDFGGRIDFRWDVEFRREKIGDVPTEMFEHFFKSLAQSAMCNLHITATGQNEHHKIEGIFKAFARAVKMAKERNSDNKLASSKGIL